MTYAERRKAREELAKARPTYKIRKGKKDITEYPEKAKPKSRQARFYDPNSPFGKKSLVYQLKAGKLREELKALQEQEREKPTEFPSHPTQSQFESAFHSGPASKDSGSSSSRRSARSASGARDAAGGRRGAIRERRSISDANQKPRHKPRKKQLEPLSIPYTTAASQFLYGKSVVEAALRSARRKLYKLYIYGGANRQNTSDDALIQALARRKGVPITILGEDGLRLMDKMASSRPHNGFVLEASPLPQPPLTALGPLLEDYASRPGYPVTLGHQSAEEAAINGTPTFIPAPSSTHKPLVVVLDQILDPGNLGAILRSVSFLGATAVAMTRKGSATLTPVALKASAGASEALHLFSVAPSLPEFLNASRANGWAVYAAVSSEEEEGPAGRGGRGGGGTKQRRHVDLHEVEEADPLRREPCVLLIGNEGEGLSRLVVKKADYEVNIPNLSGSTVVDSLNVSVAAGLLCAAFLKGVMKERSAAAREGEVRLW
ncbi:hypothetical protein VTK56DRAFT_2691 [Thermocarpiscus australiensis]